MRDRASARPTELTSDLIKAAYLLSFMPPWTEIASLASVPDRACQGGECNVNVS